ncbi:hypothetical protein lerEdw1_001061, partial [Lerista edwardsae]
CEIAAAHSDLLNRSDFIEKLKPLLRKPRFLFPSMSESWQQPPPPPQQPPHHAGTAALPEHPIPSSSVAENPLGCAVYGILLQPEPSSLQHHPPIPAGGGEASPKCGICGHDLAHLSNPQEHQCLQVGHDRSFQCTQCLKIFHQATDLLEHQCLQVEQKPFVCGVCKMGFSLLTSLAQHHSVHNGCAAVKCSKWTLRELALIIPNTLKMANTVVSEETWVLCSAQTGQPALCMVGKITMSSAGLTWPTRFDAEAVSQWSVLSSPPHGSTSALQVACFTGLGNASSAAAPVAEAANSLYSVRMFFPKP